MAAKSIKGNNNLAKRIRTRRNELNLTIEEAAEFFHLSVRHAKEIERSALRTLRQGMNDGKLV